MDGEAKERTYPADQVAVIEFVGGIRRTAELAALPANPRHLLVMRNGETSVGRFVNLISGVTLRWRDGGRNSETRELPDPRRRQDLSQCRQRPPALQLHRARWRQTRRDRRPPLPAMTTAPGEIEVQANVVWNTTHEHPGSSR